jgi:hypothetical protein
MISFSSSAPVVQNTWLLAVASTILIAFPMACNSVSAPIETTYKIRISGTNGTPFNGSVNVTSLLGKTISETKDGRIPVEFTVEGKSVSAVIRKQSDGGNLKVEILKERLLGSGFNPVAIAQTTAAYGLVSVSVN